jgi:hypothetical protein
VARRQTHSDRAVEAADLTRRRDCILERAPMSEIGTQPVRGIILLLVLVGPVQRLVAGNYTPGIWICWRSLMPIDAYTNRIVCLTGTSPVADASELCPGAAQPLRRCARAGRSTNRGSRWIHGVIGAMYSDIEAMTRWPMCAPSQASAHENLQNFKNKYYCHANNSTLVCSGHSPPSQ